VAGLNFNCRTPHAYIGGINAAAPNTPVFILHLYCRALLNQAALRACGYTKDTPNPPGGEIRATARAIQLVCSSRVRTRRFFMPLWPKARSFRRIIS